MIRHYALVGTGHGFFNEIFDEGGTPREPFHCYCRWFSEQEPAKLLRKANEAEELFRKTGITFAVYGQEETEDRLIPFDIVPRIISAEEWARVSRGIEQRVRAMNAFLHDIYHRQEIVRAGRLPEAMVSGNAAFLDRMIGFTPPGGVYSHIVGVDLVRTGPDEFYALEDNARTPSGVSYMLENRETMMSMFPELFAQVKVREVSDYPKRLRRSLSASAPPACSGDPIVAVLTPGIYNSAYFEHAFLADQMGAELVEGHDLRIVDGRVAMRTTQGYRAIDVLYRRLDDDYLDPLSFRPDSTLGVPGIMEGETGLESTCNRQHRAPERFVEARAEMRQALSLQEFDSPAVHRPIGLRVALLRVRTERAFPGACVSRVVVQKDAVGVERDDRLAHRAAGIAGL